MAKLTKKMKAIKAGVDSTKAYDINEAVEVLKNSQQRNSLKA